MNLPEFKAWFEGFTESMDGPPGAKAWERIKDRVKSIKGEEPTTKHVFHQYYERPWSRWYRDTPYWANGSVNNTVGNNGYAGSSGVALLSASQQSAALDRTAPVDQFDSQAEFNRLGRAEARSLG